MTEEQAEELKSRKNFFCEKLKASIPPSTCYARKRSLNENNNGPSFPYCVSCKKGDEMISEPFEEKKRTLKNGSVGTCDCCGRILSLRNYGSKWCCSSCILNWTIAKKIDYPFSKMSEEIKEAVEKHGNDLRVLRKFGHVWTWVKLARKKGIEINYNKPKSKKEQKKESVASKLNEEFNGIRCWRDGCGWYSDSKNNHCKIKTNVSVDFDCDKFLPIGVKAKKEKNLISEASIIISAENLKWITSTSKRTPEEAINLILTRLQRIEGIDLEPLLILYLLD